jgi:uncharacterized coiled-coil protein SlyX
MSHLQITYTVIAVLVLLLAWAGMALCQPNPQDIATATKSYKEWLTYRRMTSQPKSWNKYSHLRFHPSAPQDFEPEAITKLMEEINRNWDLDIETKDETINSLRDQLADKVVEAVKSQKKLSTLDKELREYNNTSIELLLAEKSQREAIDEIEKAEKELKELAPKPKHIRSGLVGYLNITALAVVTDHWSITER